MSVIFLLIPLSILFAVAFLFAFIWSVRAGQYEDTTTPSMRVLLDDRREGKAPAHANTPFPLTLPLSPGEREQQADVSDSMHAHPAIAAAGRRADRTAFAPPAKGTGRGEGETRRPISDDLNFQS